MGKNTIGKGKKKNWGRLAREIEATGSLNNKIKESSKNNLVEVIVTDLCTKYLGKKRKGTLVKCLS